MRIYLPATRALQFTRNHSPLGSRCSLVYAQCNPNLLYYIISFDLRGFDLIIRSVVGILHQHFHILLIDVFCLCLITHRNISSALILQFFFMSFSAVYKTVQRGFYSLEKWYYIHFYFSLPHGRLLTRSANTVHALNSAHRICRPVC